MTSTGFEIRPARLADLPFLPDLEREATQRFYDLPDMLDVPEDVTLLEEFQAGHREGGIWVAECGGRLAGFAFCGRLDGHLHLEELAVSREFGRRGIGRALVEAVIAHARREGLAGVTLTTFRDVPWNAPYYRRLGFEVLSDAEITPGLREAIDDEARRGLPPDLRVAMSLRF